jgi:nicotinate phosphoribosyltransferase
MSATALATDLYQLTMMAGYFAAGRHASTTASFELFVRRLPAGRVFLIAAGLDPFVEFLQRLHFDGEEIEQLRHEASLSALPRAFFEYLRRLRFTGEVVAVPEGTPVFANEPILRVTASIGEAQLVETAALAFLNFQTSIASKAARVVLAADGRPIYEFGARRAHGLDAALFAARAAYLAGCAGTSFVEAGVRFGIPLSGTMAHSWVLAATDESSAFRAYQELYGPRSVLLLDTYDTIAATRALIGSGLKPAGVRLDSGDLLQVSREVRRLLDTGGLEKTKIIASGDLDEFSITALLSERAPIDAFGVGTSIVTSIDAPALGGVYKLVELVEGGTVRRVRKTSPDKATWPGAKQIWRVLHDGKATRDIVAFEEERAPASAVPLLQSVVRNGRRVQPGPQLIESRAACAAKIAELPADFYTVDSTSVYEVVPSEPLRRALDTA